jgi:hypothetical protein
MVMLINKNTEVLDRFLLIRDFHSNGEEITILLEKLYEIKKIDKNEIINNFTIDILRNLYYIIYIRLL